jgi:hypothetical protein
MISINGCEQQPPNSRRQFVDENALTNPKCRSSWTAIKWDFLFVGFVDEVTVIRM